MTVKELIEQLQTLDPDLRVFTNGYEDGYDDIVNVGTIRDIALNYNHEWYYGTHTDADRIVNKEGYEIVKGVVL
jgi:hypothetical protein